MPRPTSQGNGLGRNNVWRYLHSLRSGAGFMAMGVMLGGGAFLVFDSLNPPQSARALGGFSVRERFYATCREALQDGRANIRDGEPGYRPELDADHDGVACEPFIRGRR